MAEPWLSVIMPTYNGEAHLPAALGSITRQPPGNVEVIAIDDGSTDRTLPILNSFESRLPLCVVARRHTGNWVANTNLGLSLATGRWVCFLHQDDVWMPNRIAAIRDATARHPDAALVLHSSWFINDRGVRVGRWHCPLSHRQVHAPKAVVERLIVQNFVPLPAATFRRSLAKSIGGLREDLWYTADWDFWLRLAKVGRTLYLPKSLTGFRIHAGSQTATRTDRAGEMRAQLEAVLECHANADPDVRRVAEFAAEVNVQLAAWSHGEQPDWCKLTSTWLGLGPGGWLRFYRDSRIAERVAARIRAHLQNRARPKHPIVHDTGRLPGWSLPFQRKPALR